MQKDQLYAIVDIEATGASIGKNERMIQFACVLLKNNEVVETFDTFVNPSRKVSRTIRDLTGIRSKDLATAPYFEDIATIIHTLLEDAIFVAHNVGFDFQFLNECFERVGISPLRIPAIDTVELSQVLLPTEESYQLKELVASLGYQLKQAHNALFDAKATSFLLQKLDERIKRLPLVTVESLTELSESTTADTQLFIQHALEEMKENPLDLDENLVIVEGLALRKPETLDDWVNHRDQSTYPYKEEEKEPVLKQIGLHKRLNQSAMMNTVFEYFKKDKPDFTQFVEAAAGSGKTYGYLLPSFYLASQNNKVMISTYTKVLQKQLIEESLIHLNDRLPFNRSAALMKSPTHYVSLSAFIEKRKNTSPSDVEAFFCMQLLVWLTETEEGDLEELGVGSKKTHPFWNEIKSTHTFTPTNKAFDDYNFIARRNERIEKASIIVTNHAYLFSEWERHPNTLSIPNLILDEAHHIPDVIEQSATIKLKTKTVVNDLKYLGSIIKEDSLLYELSQLESSNIKEYQLTTLDSIVQILTEEWEEWKNQWIAWARSFNDYDDKVVEWKESLIDFPAVSMNLKRDTKFIHKNIAELIYVGKQLTSILEKSKVELKTKEKRPLIALHNVVKKMEELHSTYDDLFIRNQHKGLMGLRFYSKSPQQTLSFFKFNEDKRKMMLDIFKQKGHVLLTSSTLSVKGSIRFMEEALNLKQTEFSAFESSYDYEKQARLFIPTEQRDVGKKQGKKYSYELAKQIEAIVSQTTENCLVLFRSQETIQEVYKLLMRRRKLKQKTLLAQYITGTPTKITKLFKKSEQSVVLGSDSFWEGVDFPEDELKIVIMTRLPFDSPEMPLVKKRHQELRDKGENPFVKDLLPRAAVKFKQGIGRLIRSSKDKGVWIVLDRRLVDSSYASVFLESLPEVLPVEELPLNQIIEEMNTFLETKKNTKNK